MVSYAASRNIPTATQKKYVQGEPMGTNAKNPIPNCSELRPIFMGHALILIAQRILMYPLFRHHSDSGSHISSRLHR